MATIHHDDLLFISQLLQLERELQFTSQAWNKAPALEQIDVTEKYPFEKSFCDIAGYEFRVWVVTVIEKLIKHHTMRAETHAELNKVRDVLRALFMTSDKYDATLSLAVDARREIFDERKRQQTHIN